MGRIRFTPEQIIGILREADVLLGQGTNIGEAIWKLGVSEYHWALKSVVFPKRWAISKTLAPSVAILRPQV